MNIVNRLITVLVLLVAILLAGVAIVVPRQVITALQQGLTTLGIALTSPLNYVLWALFWVLVIVVAVLLLWLQIPRGPRHAVRIAQVKGGEATLSIEAIVQRLQQELGQVTQVQELTPKVTPRGSSVNVHLDLLTDPDVDIPSKTREVLGLARETLEKKMGLKAGKISVQVKHGALPAKPARVAPSLLPKVEPPVPFTPPPKVEPPAPSTPPAQTNS
jgi:uncharacterized alkaline shock family protein YloU